MSALQNFRDGYRPNWRVIWAGAFRVLAGSMAVVMWLLMIWDYWHDNIPKATLNAVAALTLWLMSQRTAVSESDGL